MNDGKTDVNSMSADGGRADESRECEVCGAQIDIDQWHPVVADTDDDGAFQLYAFCTQDCRDVWEN